MGGKAKIAKPIARYLQSIRQPGQLYIEPFVGAANILMHMTSGGPCLAYDAHPDLILLWQALQKGWKPPTRVSRALHRKLRHSAPSALRAFVGFACSYSAKFFAGWAFSKRNPRYAGEGSRGLARKMPFLQNVPFQQRDYSTILNPANALIYCDPPYAGTAGFRGVPQFDHEKFWDTMRRWSQNNTVIISETTAPPDFQIVMQLSAPRGIRKHSKARNGKPRTEFLFRLGA